jgi:tRNA(Arg) A34 adenosine deaminase TadA
MKRSDRGRKLPELTQNSGRVMSEHRDKEFLRRAIALSEEAMASGGRPFGAVICDGAGQIVAEARSVAPVDWRDWTAHSEMQALRAASAAMSCESLGRAT